MGQTKMVDHLRHRVNTFSLCLLTGSSLISQGLKNPSPSDTDMFVGPWCFTYSEFHEIHSPLPIP